MIRRKPSRRGKRTSKRRKSRLALRKECDRRFALAVKVRDAWRCVMCGQTSGLQCAHILSRAFHATRWMLGNAATLCAGCHFRGHKDPLRFEDWVRARLGDVGYEELRAIAKRGTPWIDYEQVAVTCSRAWTPRNWWRRASRRRRGSRPYSPGLAQKLLDEFAQRGKPEVKEEAHLSDRQRQVLELVADGLSYKEIGVRLSLSPRTIKYHMAEIMQRLHLEHRAQVLAFAGRLTR